MHCGFTPIAIHKYALTVLERSLLRFVKLFRREFDKALTDYIFDFEFEFSEILNAL